MNKNLLYDKGWGKTMNYVVYALSPSSSLDADSWAAPLGQTERKT